MAAVPPGVAFPTLRTFTRTSYPPAGEPVVSHTQVLPGPYGAGVTHAPPATRAWNSYSNGPVPLVGVAVYVTLLPLAVLPAGSAERTTVAVDVSVYGIAAVALGVASPTLRMLTMTSYPPAGDPVV